MPDHIPTYYTLASPYICFLAFEALDWEEVVPFDKGQPNYAKDLPADSPRLIHLPLELTSSMEGGGYVTRSPGRGGDCC